MSIADEAAAKTDCVAQAICLRHLRRTPPHRKPSSRAAPGQTDIIVGHARAYTMNLTAAQIAQVAANAGFAGADLATAVAIALAESGGDPSVIGDKTLAPSNGPSYGLWQINIGSSANPQYAGENLLDPQTNANIAFEMYSAKGFRPWSTYTSGQYGMYETAAMMAAVSNVGAGFSPSPVTLDASTGQPIVSATPTADTSANLFTAASNLTAPSTTDVLLLGGLGLAALLLVSEA